MAKLVAYSSPLEAIHFSQQSNQNRSSKRIKRQLTNILELGLPMQSNVISSPSECKMVAEPISYHSLACFEDPSFMYKTNFNVSHTSDLNTSSHSSSAFSDLSSANDFNSISDSASSPAPSSALSSTSASSASSSASSSSSSSSSCSSSSPTPPQAAPNSAASSTSFCISAFDYCHLTSASSLFSDSLGHLRSAYTEDEQVFDNLILKERAELWRRDQLVAEAQTETQTETQTYLDHRRHSLVAWMLHVCERQSCQDDIFALATMILDKFIRIMQPANSSLEADQSEALKRRQLVMFAACSILLAAKFRQTPKLYIQDLVEYSKSELPIGLTRDEILDGELLLLTSLRWDLAALITPNDFIPLLIVKCSHLSFGKLSEGCQPELNVNNPKTTAMSQCDESRVKRHTQTLLELCLMGK